MKGNEQESYKSRNSEKTVRDKEYSKTCSEQTLYSLKGEDKYSMKQMKNNVRYETCEDKEFDNKHHSKRKDKHTDRESDQSRKKKRKKSTGEPELRYYEHSEGRKDREGCAIEKHEKARRQHRESSSGKSQKKEGSESDRSYEYLSCRENSKGSRHSKSKGY